MDKPDIEVYRQEIEQLQMDMHPVRMSTMKPEERDERWNGIVYASEKDDRVAYIVKFIVEISKLTAVQGKWCEDNVDMKKFPNECLKKKDSVLFRMKGMGEAFRMVSYVMSQLLVYTCKLYQKYDAYDDEIEREMEAFKAARTQFLEIRPIHEAMKQWLALKIDLLSRTFALSMSEVVGKVDEKYWKVDVFHELRRKINAILEKSKLTWENVVPTLRTYVESTPFEVNYDIDGVKQELLEHLERLERLEHLEMHANDKLRRDILLFNKQRRELDVKLEEELTKKKVDEKDVIAVVHEYVKHHMELNTCRFMVHMRSFSSAATEKAVPFLTIRELPPCVDKVCHQVDTVMNSKKLESFEDETVYKWTLKWQKSGKCQQRLKEATFLLRNRISDEKSEVFQELLERYENDQNNFSELAILTCFLHLVELFWTKEVKRLKEEKADVTEARAWLMFSKRIVHSEVAVRALRKCDGDVEKAKAMAARESVVGWHIFLFEKVRRFAAEDVYKNNIKYALSPLKRTEYWFWLPQFMRNDVEGFSYVLSMLILTLYRVCV
jgi:hypothetical protein